MVGTTLSAPLDSILSETIENSIHLAVFIEPYLTFVLDGKKTIDSRFSVNRHPPFEQVRKGDLLVLKQSSGPVCGVCRVSNAWYYRLDPKSWSEIERYAAALCMDDSEFWKKKRDASFATLIRLENVVRIPEIAVNKLDPRGWVVLKDAKQQRSLI
ncbi:MAG: ASCH domain-containing protein [Acidobacteria bacterium]|nr:ASCH domain-containing protein [Acidobacteriota bacterium]